MKKALIVFLLSAFTFAAKAQNEKVTVKPTSTPTQKVHNVFSKHNKYKGYKIKHRHANGKKHVTKVNTTNGAVKQKEDH